MVKSQSRDIGSRDIKAGAQSTVGIIQTEARRALLSQRDEGPPLPLLVVQVQAGGTAGPSRMLRSRQLVLGLGLLNRGFSERQ
jgi:hypothetical protein